MEVKNGGSEVLYYEVECTLQ